MMKLGILPAASRRHRNTPGEIRPRSSWWRLLVVLATLGASYLALITAVALAGWLGIDPEQLQGSRFNLSTVTLGLFLVYQMIQALIVFASQRFIHRGRFRDLGFRAPVLKGFVAGFAIGVAIPAAELIVTLTSGHQMALRWNVPAQVSTASLLIHYLCFFVVFLNANSFGEELVFRCYPIEQFRGNPLMTGIVIVLSTGVFAAIHFIIGAFDTGWLVRMIFGSILYSTAYLLFRSLWLVIGIHSGINFVSFTLAGNWKMGGLVQLSGHMPPPLAGHAAMLCTYVLVLALMVFVRYGGVSKSAALLREPQSPVHATGGDHCSSSGS